MTTAPGAEAPNRSMPTASSTQRRQPMVEPASTASDGSPAPSTSARKPAGCSANSSHDGSDTTRAATCSAASSTAASQHTPTSLPVPTRVIRAPAGSRSK